MHFISVNYVVQYHSFGNTNVCSYKRAFHREVRKQKSEIAITGIGCVRKCIIGVRSVLN